MNSSAKVWFITGSNSGFGLALTKAVLEKGDRVIATSRHPEELDDGPYRNHEALRKIHLSSRRGLSVLLMRGIRDGTRELSRFPPSNCVVYKKLVS